MKVMNITIAIESDQGQSVHVDTLAAINALQQCIKDASESQPALGGVLKNASGRIVGSYVVEFAS